MPTADSTSASPCSARPGPSAVPQLRVSGVTVGPPYPRVMELEVRHLRALCAIADTGSLHKAARQLGMSQPSLTTQLRRIENSLGAELFSRERTGCRPTPLGRSVLSRARPLRRRNGRARRRGQGGRGAGPAAPGCASAPPPAARWPAGCAGCAQRLPGTDISLHVDVSANALLRMVAAGQLDVAFVHEVEGCPLLVPGRPRPTRTGRARAAVHLHGPRPSGRRRARRGARRSGRGPLDGRPDGGRRVGRAAPGAAARPGSTRRCCTATTSRPRP